MWEFWGVVGGSVLGVAGRVGVLRAEVVERYPDFFFREFVALVRGWCQLCNLCLASMAWEMARTLSRHISWIVRHARHSRTSSRSASAASFAACWSDEDIL